MSARTHLPICNATMKPKDPIRRSPGKPSGRRNIIQIDIPLRDNSKATDGASCHFQNFIEYFVSESTPGLRGTWRLPIRRMDSRVDSVELTKLPSKPATASMGHAMAWTWASWVDMTMPCMSDAVDGMGEIQAIWKAWVACHSVGVIFMRIFF